MRTSGRSLLVDRWYLRISANARSPGLHLGLAPNELVLTAVGLLPVMIGAGRGVIRPRLMIKPWLLSGVLGEEDVKEDERIKGDATRTGGWAAGVGAASCLLAFT